MADPMLPQLRCRCQSQSRYGVNGDQSLPGYSPNPEVCGNCGGRITFPNNGTGLGLGQATPRVGPTLVYDGTYPSVPLVTQRQDVWDPNFGFGYYSCFESAQEQRDGVWAPEVQPSRSGIVPGNNTPVHSGDSQERDVVNRVEHYAGMDSLDPSEPPAPRRDEPYAYSRLLIDPTWIMPAFAPTPRTRQGARPGDRLEDLPYDSDHVVASQSLYATEHDYNNTDHSVYPPLSDGNRSSSGSGYGNADQNGWMSYVNWPNSSSEGSSAGSTLDYWGNSGREEKVEDSHEEADSDHANDEMDEDTSSNSGSSSSSDDSQPATVTIRDGKIELGDEWKAPDAETAVRDAPPEVGWATTISSHQVDDNANGESEWVDVHEGLAPADLTMSGGLSNGTS
ncbi:hypothetical protein Hte_000966 [Hypoxylon texense]